MKILFLDDTKQKRCPRDRMGDLVGVGGVLVDSSELKNLESGLEKLARDNGFPRGEVFKWSPRRSDWMYDNLKGEKRTAFIENAILLCLSKGAQFVVSVVDVDKKHATSGAKSHELDALNLTLERFDTFLGYSKEHGLVFVAKPSGGPSDEHKLLSQCVELLKDGTGFVDFNRLAMNVVTLPFKLSRVLQCADLVVAITVSMVSGQEKYAKSHFENIKCGFIKNSKGQIGGTGLKLHPDFLYKNLYHWLLGDDVLVRGLQRFGLPDANSPYAGDASRYDG